MDIEINKAQVFKTSQNSNRKGSSTEFAVKLEHVFVEMFSSYFFIFSSIHAYPESTWLKGEESGWGIIVLEGTSGSARFSQHTIFYNNSQHTHSHVSFLVLGSYNMATAIYTLYFYAQCFPLTKGSTYLQTPLSVC